jgi:hypothetical protein
MNDYSVIVTAKYKAIVHAENEEEAISKFGEVIIPTIENNENSMFDNVIRVEIDRHTSTDSTGIVKNKKQIEAAKSRGYYIK